MPKFTIKNRFTNTILVEAEAATLKKLVEKRGADLHEANLYGADLHGADLCGADLHKADLCGAEIKITQKDQLLKALKIIIED